MSYVVLNHIIYYLLSAILDIKAENILVKFDTVTGKCQHLKLCDFGLSCRFEPTEPLREFCGSPGFFDPDMLVEVRQVL